MEKNKIIGVFFASCMLVSSALFSEEMPSVKPNGCKGAVLCPSYPIYGRCDDCCDYRWSVNLGLLYQQPWMSNMGAGTASTGEAVLQFTNPYKNSTSVFLEECFDYSLGITAGIGYFIEHDNWFFLVDFDWLSSKTSNNYDAIGTVYHLQGFTNQSVLYDLFITNNNIYGNNFTSLKTKAELNIYDLNFSLSRGSFHSKCFSYEPFAGVKALWYNGSQTRLAYNTSTTGFIAANAYLETDFNYDSWGAGPVFGFNAEYFLTEQLSLFSDSDLAVLYGRINSYNSSSAVQSSINNELNNVAEYVQDFNQPYFIPVRTVLGVKLGKYCLEDRHYIALKIGYDARYILADSGLFGDVGTTAFPVAGSGTVPIMPTNGYSIAANGLYLNFIWNF